MLYLNDILYDLKAESQASLTKTVTFCSLSRYSEQLNLLTRHLFWINYFIISILMSSFPNSPSIFIYLKHSCASSVLYHFKQLLRLKDADISQACVLRRHLLCHHIPIFCIFTFRSHSSLVNPYTFP